MRKKVKRANLAELKTTMPVIELNTQKSFVGGAYGDITDPYTWEDYSMVFKWSNPNGYYFGGTNGTIYKNGMQVGTYTGGTDAGLCFGGTDYYNGGTGGEYNNNSYNNMNQTQNTSLTDGLSIWNEKYFTFKTKTQSTTKFHSQLTSILRSNSILKNILSRFDKGTVHLTFRVSSLGSTIGAYTHAASQESFHIVFNSDMINKDGFVKPYGTVDNIGCDWNLINTPEETLIVILAHEALHAKHFAIYYEAYREGNGDPSKSVKWLKEQSHPNEFINIFYTEISSGKWSQNSQQEIEDRLHKYMKAHDIPVINAALNEYRREFNL